MPSSPPESLAELVLPEAAPGSPDPLPPYWAEACRTLARKDRVMKKLIANAADGPVLQSRGDAYTTLLRSVVGQQISVKAAQAVWQRFSALANPLTPESLLRLRVDDMRAAGLSARKVDYVVDLSLRFASGDLRTAQWDAMSDEDIIQALVAVRGIGRWTAEMFLIFHLRRPNVLPLDDVGLVNGIRAAYFSGEAVSRSDVREVAQAWSPFATVATWYIWRSLEPVPVQH